jgi:hypothetical protein
MIFLIFIEHSPVLIVLVVSCSQHPGIVRLVQLTERKERASRKSINLKEIKSDACAKVARPPFSRAKNAQPSCRKLKP